MVLALLGVSMIYYFGWKGYTPDQMRQHLAAFFGVQTTPQAGASDGGTTAGGTGNVINVPPVQVGPVTTPGVQIDNDCTLQPGDTRVGPFIWRPIGSGIAGQINGKLIGPCP